MSKRIKELRIAKGLTLLQLANKLGVSEGTVQRYESGNIPNLKYDTIVALSNALDTTPTYLMGWDDKEVDYIVFTDDEQTLIEQYRKLDNIHKQRLAEIMRFYLMEQEEK